MIDYIKGTIEELTATETTVENNGIGYKISYLRGDYKLCTNPNQE